MLFAAVFSNAAMAAVDDGKGMVTVRFDASAVATDLPPAVHGAIDTDNADTAGKLLLAVSSMPCNLPTRHTTTTTRLKPLSP